MKTLEELRIFFQNVRFATQQGITIDSVDAAGGAVCSVTLEARHLNAMGSAQGGLIYTLADFAFAAAANAQQLGTVTVSSAIQYLRAPKGQRLIASALPRSAGRSICHYEIAVRDELDTPVAQVLITGYRTQAKNG